MNIHMLVIRPRTSSAVRLGPDNLAYEGRTNIHSLGDQVTVTVLHPS